MKKIGFFIAAFICLLATVSCTQPEVPATKITITSPTDILKIGESLTLAVIVEPENATDKNYLLTVDNPDIATLDGNVLTAVAKGSVVIKAELGELKDSIVIATEFSAEPPQPVDYQILSDYCDVFYWGEFRGGTDNITIHMGNVPHTEMYVTGPGESVIISIQIPHFEDYEDAAMVPGTYTLDPNDTFKAMSIVGFETDYTIYSPDSNGDDVMEKVTFRPKEATLTIEESGNGHRVEFSMTLKNGETLWSYYEGELWFLNAYARMMPPENDQDQNFECGWGEITYSGGGRYWVDMVEGDEDADLEREGRKFLDLYITSSTDDNTALAPGRYTVGTQGTNTVDPGDFVFDGIGCYPTGSHYCISHRYENGEGGVFTEFIFGHFLEGYVDIAREGENYVITVDVIDRNGYSIKATYNAPMPFIDNTTAGA